MNTLQIRSYIADSLMSDFQRGPTFRRGRRQGAGTRGLAILYLAFRHSRSECATPTARPEVSIHVPPPPKKRPSSLEPPMEQLGVAWP